jgi:hypothetical protein
VPVDDLPGFEYRGTRGDEGRVYLESMPADRAALLKGTGGEVLAAVLAAGVVDKELRRGGSGGPVGLLYVFFRSPGGLVGSRRLPNILSAGFKTKFPGARRSK